VAVCPTGALIEKPSRFQGRSYKLKTVRTVCPYCGVGCRIVLYVRDGRLVRAKGEEAPPNEGKLCVKGRFGFEFVHSKERLTKPLIRKNGRLVEASWDEALDLVAQKFKELKERYGPESLAVLASSRATNESNYLAQKFARTVLGTNNIDNCARICHAPSVHGLYRAFGSGAMTNSIAEIGGAECLFLIGSNPTEAHPVIGARIRRAVQKGTKLIVADPRDIELAKMADIHLQLRPGTDVALANAIVHHIVKQGLHSEKFIEERTENFEKMWAVVEKYTPEYAEKITGVPARLIREAAEMYAKSEPSMVLYCLGITEHRNGVETVMSVANLALVTGHIGKPSSGVSPIRGQNNVQGACDVAALPEFLPGYQRWEDPEVVKKFEEAWGVKLPPAGQGIFCSWLWEKALAGGVKGVYAIGEDVAMSEPNVDRVRRALSEMEFLVVQELFMTPTAELADVVLPAASFAEVDGTYTNTERRVQRVRKALEPPGEARPDWEIICEISKRMGYPMDYEHPSEIFEEMRKLMPIYGGITYKRLEEGPGLQWPCPTEDHPGTPYLHKGKFTRGKGRFHGIEHQGPAEEPDDEYPFLLTTGRILEQYNVATMTRRTPGLEELAPENFVEVSPKDAERLRLSEGEVVRVVSRRGAVEARVRIRDIKEGVVWMPFHYAESPTNRITNEATDPICGTPEVKACAVRIEKLI
jgi:formate dehydrogenase alpha subunit